MQITSEHQDVVGLSPVLLRLLTAGGGEVLRTSAQSLLKNNTMSPGPPGVNPLLDPSSYFVGCSGMSGSLQYHRHEEYELLQVPLYVPHPMQLVILCPEEATPNLPTWHVVTAGGHDCKVKPPPLPQPVV